MSDLVQRIKDWQEQQETYDPESWDLLIEASQRIKELEQVLTEHHVPEEQWEEIQDE